MPKHVTWEPKPAALRDLFLLVLYRAEGHSIGSDDGKVATILRERARVPHTKNNNHITSHVLLMMKDDGYISRQMTKSGRGTRGVVLTRLLTEEMVRELEVSESANLLYFTHDDVFSEPPEEEKPFDTKQDEYSDLVEACRAGLEAIRKASLTAERQTNQGLAIINVTDILRGIGIRGKRVDEVRYYLRMLGLAHAVRKSETKGDRCWWWEVSDKELDPDKLRKMASGERSYASYLLTEGRRDPLEDGVRERRFAGRVPAMLPDGLVSPVTVSHVSDKIPKEEEVAVTAQPAEEVAAVSGGDRVADLLVIIETLERDKENLERALTQAAEAHAAEVGKLRGQVETLTAKLKEYEANGERADEVIARYLGSPGQPE